MGQERDLPLGDIDDVSVDDEKSRSRGGGQGGGKPPRRPSQPPAGDSSMGGNIWMIATLVLLAVLLVLSAFFYRELTTVRGQMDAELARSTEQLDRLSSHLSATDETLVQSSDQVQETLDMHMSEIRKLWAIGNERNRGWIEDNQQAINSIQEQRGQLERGLGSVREELNAMKEQVGSLRRAVEQGDTERDRLQTRLELAMESVQRMERELSSQEKVLGEINNSLPELRKLVELQRSGAGVAARLREIETAISAFDAYRREVNNRLDGVEAGR